MAKRWPAFFAAHDEAVPFLLSLNSVIHPEVRKLYPGAYCPHFDFTSPPDGSLLIADGALGSRGAWLKAPYADAPANTGLPRLTPAPA